MNEDEFEHPPRKRFRLRNPRPDRLFCVLFSVPTQFNRLWKFRKNGQPSEVRLLVSMASSLLGGKVLCTQRPNTNHMIPFRRAIPRPPGTSLWGTFRAFRNIDPPLAPTNKGTASRSDLQFARFSSSGRCVEGVVGGFANGGRCRRSGLEEANC